MTLLVYPESMYERQVSRVGFDSSYPILISNTENTDISIGYGMGDEDGCGIRYRTDVVFTDIGSRTRYQKGSGYSYGYWIPL